MTEADAIPVHPIYSQGSRHLPDQISQGSLRLACVHVMAATMAIDRKHFHAAIFIPFMHLFFLYFWSMNWFSALLGQKKEQGCLGLRFKKEQACVGLWEYYFVQIQFCPSNSVKDKVKVIFSTLKMKHYLTWYIFRWLYLKFRLYLFWIQFKYHTCSLRVFKLLKTFVEKEANKIGFEMWSTYIMCILYITSKNFAQLTQHTMLDDFTIYKHRTIWKVAQVVCFFKQQNYWVPL